METRDHATPDREHPEPEDENTVGDDVFTLGDGGSRELEPQLHGVLRGIADGVAPAPDLMPAVLRRAVRIRRRQRAVRATSATAVLAVVAVLTPSIVAQIGGNGGDQAAAAPPPSAVVDLASAYPAANAVADPEGVGADGRPANALSWKPRGVAMPTEAVELAKSFLLDRAARSGMPKDVQGQTKVVVDQLWAQVEPSARTNYRAHLYVMQGWTSGPNGTSQAVLLVGEYIVTGGYTEMTVFSSPVAFTHLRAGSTADGDDADQIAELSVWLPASNRLLVLGAPQTRTVYYAKTGGGLIQQKTSDGVALFPRTKEKPHGQFADTIQVRDAQNRALTPPTAWSAADFPLTGAGSVWISKDKQWQAVAPYDGPVPIDVTPVDPADTTTGPRPVPTKTSPAGSHTTAGEPPSARPDPTPTSGSGSPSSTPTSAGPSTSVSSAAPPSMTPSGSPNVSITGVQGLF